MFDELRPASANTAKSRAVSATLHTAAVIVAFAVGGIPDRLIQIDKKPTTLFARVPLATVPSPTPGDKDQGGGGGGGQDDSPALQGRLPEPAKRHFVPPSQAAQNNNPALVLEASLIVPPQFETSDTHLRLLGDPLSNFLNGTPSNGPGLRGGIGEGDHGGVGPGEGPGSGPGDRGGFGGGVFRVGGGVTSPVPYYRIEPEYSDEARQAKFSGTVVLSVVIDEEGKPVNLKVVTPLGLGLDEKAIEAVKKWRFRPGTKDGKPVAVQAEIHVNFRLL